MRAAALVCLVLAAPAAAFETVFPNATVVVQEESPADSVRLPRTAWSDGTAFSGVEGGVRKTVLQLPNSALTTLQLLQPVRARLGDLGYTEVFSCADVACGGFDFRFQLDLIPAPAMYVDLGDFRYLLMEHSDLDREFVSVVTSSSAVSGYVHVTEVFKGETFVANEAVNVDAPAPVPPDLVSRLIETGHVVLSDLEFPTGSADLSAGPYASLETLAEWLKTTPSARIVLVGHTDSVGSLDANTQLSRRRALSVLERLADGLDVDTAQVSSDGAGALAPLASNLTEEGRATNRRVEVVLLSLD